MTATRPGAIVLAGDGINCESETSWALSVAGFEPTIVQSGDLLANPGKLAGSQLLAIPGGFSFGDEIASGKVLAVKMRSGLAEALHAHIDRGGLVLGICNGFQVLVQLGLLPFSDHNAPRVVSLTHNAGGRFINRWVELDVSPAASSPFLKSLSRIHLPIRHGEGRIAVGGGPAAEDSVREHAAMRYCEDINGSFERIAALVNSAGNVLGLMPHPEAFVRWSQHPAWGSWKRPSPPGDPRPGRHPRYPDNPPDGLAILQNAAAAFA